jgi:SAM-dependent methyltransferase
VATVNQRHRVGPISQDLLDIATKTRTNPLPWKGQFSPQLIEAILAAAGQHFDHVLDPFAGSGTVLYEAIRSGSRSTGVEVNPAAVMLARIYTLAEMTPRRRDDAVHEVDRVVAGSVSLGPLFSGQDHDDSAEIQQILGATVSSAAKVIINALAVLSGDSGKPPTHDAFHAAWPRIRDLIASLPDLPVQTNVVHGDARNLEIPDQSVDIIITSPPYINVFNYHQQYRTGVEQLGLEVLPIARSEIGSNRQNRGNRYRTVVQYCLDMELVLREWVRVLKPSGRAVVIVGRESRVRGTPFFNGALLASIATNTPGLVIEQTQERQFTNRYGYTIVEDILYLRCGAATPLIDSVSARSVARDALLEARKQTSPVARPDLEQALAEIDNIEPSPQLFDELRILPLPRDMQ